MGYSDQRYYALKKVPLGFATSFGTATASSATGHTLSDVAAFSNKFIKRTKVNNIRLRCTTIPNAASTAVVVNAMNGTNTLATVTVTTATADQFLDFTMGTGTFGTFTADSELKFNMTGTATASGAANGAYDILVEEQELPAL